MSQPTPPQSAANNLPENEPEPRKGCGCQGGCLVTLAVLAVLLGILMAALPIGVRYIARKGQTAAEIQKMQDVQSIPVNFPKEWGEVKPYSKELAEQLARAKVSSAALLTTFTTQLQDTSMSLALVETLHGQPLTHSETWTSIVLTARSGEPLLEELKKLAAIPDFDTDLLEEPEQMFSYRTVPDNIYPMHRWLAVAASATAAQDGNCTAALDFALLPLRLAKRHPATAAHQQAGLLIYNGSHQVANVAGKCQTTETLRALLNQMNELAASVLVTTDHPPQFLKALGQLRRYKRDGFPSDLEPGKPQFHYSFVAMEAAAGLYPKFMAENLPFTDKRRADFQRQVEELETMMGGPVRITPLMALRGARMVAPDFLVRMFNFDAMNGTPVSPTVYFDLARLRVARQLALLEGNATTTASASLVPKYLPSDPVDPYTKSPYLWDAKTERYYSIGPDLIDQHLSSEVDHANRFGGGSATGDIAVPAMVPANAVLHWY